MALVVQYGLLFIVGLVQDLLVTSYYKAISRHAPVPSAILSAMVTIVNLTVFYGILVSLDQSVFSKIFVYALGNALGTFIIVHNDKDRRPTIAIQ